MKLLKINKFSKDFNKTSRHVVLSPPPHGGHLCFLDPTSPWNVCQTPTHSNFQLGLVTPGKNISVKMLLHYTIHG